MSINQSSINVTVRVKEPITVTVPDRRTAATTNTQPIVLKGQSRNITYLQDLLDIEEASQANGATLVYDSTTDKYVVKQLTLGDLDVTSLDGGTF